MTEPGKNPVRSYKVVTKRQPPAVGSGIPRQSHREGSPVTLTAPEATTAAAIDSGFADAVQATLTEVSLNDGASIPNDVRETILEAVCDAYGARMRVERGRVVRVIHENRDLVERVRGFADHLAQVERSQLPILQSRNHHASHASYLRSLLDKVSLLVHERAETGVGVVSLDELREILNGAGLMPVPSPAPTPLSLVVVRDGKLGQFNDGKGRPHAFPLVGYSVVVRPQPGETGIEPAFQMGLHHLTQSQMEASGFTLHAIV